MADNLPQYYWRLQDVLPEVLKLLSYLKDVLESALRVLMEKLDDDVYHVV